MLGFQALQNLFYFLNFFIFCHTRKLGFKVARVGSLELKKVFHYHYTLYRVGGSAFGFLYLGNWYVLLVVAIYRFCEVWGLQGRGVAILVRFLLIFGFFGLKYFLFFGLFFLLDRLFLEIVLAGLYFLPLG